MKPVTALELYKATPRTNCKECGFATCLAFSTCVVVEKKPIHLCPHLEEGVRQALAERIAEQQRADIYVKRDLYKYTADDIRTRLRERDFSAVSKGIGADCVEQDGEGALRFRYLNRDCLLSRTAILLDGQPAADRWDDILLYNYVFLAGHGDLAGEWIPIEQIPGHIPKKSGLEKGCEEKIVRHFEGRVRMLEKAAISLGGSPDEGISNADASWRFLPLPKVPFRLLFWDHVPEEGFPARAKVLFDRSLTRYLDIESLVFLAEKFAQALIEADAAG